MTEGKIQASDANSEANPVCRVIVFAVPSEPEMLAEILQRHLGLQPIDARIHAHAVPGILPDRLSLSQARLVASEIERLGITTEVIAEQDIPHLDHAEVIHHAVLTEANLRILDVHGRVGRQIPWKEIELLSVGYVPLETAVHIPVDPTVVISAAPRPPGSSYDYPALSGPEAWLILTGEPRTYRINHKEMNYETLDDRKTASASVNFRLFAGDLVAHTPNAFFPPATHAFLNRGLLRHYLFRSSEELQQYTQFHLLLLRRMRRM